MFKEKYRQSLQFRFLLFILAILLLSTTILSIVISANERTVLINSLKLQGQKRAAFIAKLSIDPLLANNTIQLDTIVNDSNKEDFIYTIIQDTKGNLLTSQYASINHGSPKIMAVLSKLSKDTELQDIISAIKKAETVIELSAPIMIDIKPIGKVIMGITLHRINQQVLKTIMFVITLNLAVAFVLGIVLFSASKRIVLTPIAELARATSALADGDLSTQVRIKATGEIQTLVDSFNKMAADLKKTMVSKEALEDSEEKFRAITTTATDAVILMNHEGKIEYWNPVAEKIFGYSRDEIKGKEFHLIIAPERYHNAYREGFRKFARTGEGPAIGNTLEFMAVRKDGTEFPIKVSVSAIQRKGQWYAVGIVRDITERKQTEEALKDSEKNTETL
ncbi:MAG: PAS domain S-box protein [Nitrospirae bacterium]|nr:PAS domain S-box protein [Nitrospirota bacterium]